tara:strand:- start:162 stop:1124 length:963 start_codon:yes stop_codon:yes gene_type:complete
MSFRKILNLFKFPVDIILSILIIPASFLMLFFRSIGGHKLKISKYILKRIGIFPITKNYYEPIFDFDNLKIKLTDKRNLPGIDFNIEFQKKFLKNLNYFNELKELNLSIISPKYNFNINNNFFQGGDAEIYYSMLRYFKPKNVVEIGSGHSSLIALEAIEKNFKIDGVSSELLCIEPYENKWLEKNGVKVIREKIEDVDEELILKLNENDILFIDSSHIIKPQGDILKIFLEIFPRLKKGVIVHIHDIFSPRDYPTKWLKEENRFYNEQYLLETIMDHSKRYKILLSLNYLKNDYYSELKNNCPYLNKNSEPSSIYLEVI